MTVGKASTTTALALTTSAPVFGQSVTLTATITPATTGSASPTGTVTFLNARPHWHRVTNGMATLTTTLPVGTYSITADYPGDTNYATSTSTPPVSVKSRGIDNDSGSQLPDFSGRARECHVNCDRHRCQPWGGDADRNHSILQRYHLARGPGDHHRRRRHPGTTSIPAGTNTITADYASDGNFAASTSSPLPLTVAAAATSTTTVMASTNSPVFGQR